MEMGQWWMEVLIGIGAGLFSGLLGIGGGFIVVPAMALLLGVDQQTAQGTALAIIAVIALAGTLNNLRAGLVSLRGIWWVALPAMAASAAGATVANLLPEDVLRRIFGALVATVALYTLHSALTGVIYPSRGR
jgi:uncharacterized protein